jgi:L-lactate dehydrogenase complex protein LldG
MARGQIPQLDEKSEKGMSDSREAILSRVRGALAPLPKRAPYPEYARNVATMPGLDLRSDLWSVFKTRTQLVNGAAYDSLAELGAWLRAQNLLRGYCDPRIGSAVTQAFGSGFQIETIFDRTRVDDYTFGITRAVGAIAETGTVILNDSATSSRLGALAPWVHVAVVAREKIYPDVAAAVAELGQDPNIVWCTGPSKTADVEGILIQGVHGPGVQVTVLAS